MALTPGIAGRTDPRVRVVHDIQIVRGGGGGTGVRLTPGRDWLEVVGGYYGGYEGHSL